MTSDYTTGADSGATTTLASHLPVDESVLRAYRVYQHSVSVYRRSIAALQRSERFVITSCSTIESNNE